MLITKRNLLAHRILTNDFEVEYGAFDKQIIYATKDFNEKFNGQIFKISKHFADGMSENGEKLLSLFDDMLKEDNIPVNIAFIEFFQQEFLAVLDFGANVICFEITANKLFVATYSGLKDEKARLGLCQLNSLSCASKATLDGLKLSKAEHVFYEIFKIIVIFLMFKKYAIVETIIVNKKSKQQLDDQKIKNETPYSIQYMDCKWFTTIVRSEGFKVRGHFRLQPKKKDGEWTKELIYIEEFSKNGYTSVAKTLNEV